MHENKIRIGFIGTGRISYRHARNLLQLDCVEITAVSGSRPDRMNAFQHAFQLWHASLHEDYRDMLQRSDIDAVIICSPHTFHFQQANDSLLSGRHVLIEKPMTCTVDEAKRLLETQRKSGKVLQVAYQRHFDPAFEYIRTAISEGTIGRLTSVTATLFQNWKLAHAQTWRQDAALSGGGMLMDSGSHILDIVLRATNLKVCRVNAELHQRDTSVDIDSMITVCFANDVIGAIQIVGFAPCYHESYRFVGENGALFYDNGQVLSFQYNQEGPRLIQLPAQTTDIDKSFVDSILGKHSAIVPGEHALEVMQVTEKIYQQMEMRKR